VHDDVVFIVNNPQIDRFDLGSIFLYTSTPDEVNQSINAYYRPLLEFIYRLQYKIFALNPHGFHLFNVLIHILSAFFVFRLGAIVWKENVFLAFLLSVFFLIHPIQSEAVACISGISNLIFTFLALLMFWFYTSAGASQGTYKRFLYYTFALLSLLLALLAKEQAVILPFLILIYELFLSDRKIDKREKVWRVSGLFVLLGGYFLIRKTILGSTMPALMDAPHEFILRVMAIPRTLLMYMRLIVWPTDLHYYRSTDILQSNLVAMIIFLLFIGCVIFAVRKVSDEERRVLLFGMSWFIVSLSPMLNIIPLINEYSFILTADHFLYMPLVGALIVLITLFYAVLKKSRNNSLKRVTTGFIVLLCLSCIMLTRLQNTFWRGEIPLFERTLRYEPQLGRVHILLSNAYYFNGQFEKALKQNHKALKIMRSYMRKIKDGPAQKVYLGFIKGIQFNNAHYYESMNMLKEARYAYQEAIKIDPRDSVLYNNIGMILIKLNQLDKAIENLQKAIKLNPSNLMAKNNLAICFIQKGQPQRAEALFREILTQDAHFPSANDNLNRLLEKNG